MKKFLYIYIISLLMIACKKDKEETDNTPSTRAVEHLLMGNPSSAVSDSTMHNNYLMVKEQYSLSYNRDRGIPNWVSWHLDNTWIGSTERQNDFRSDASLPAEWYKVQSTDYSGSGFDRGHHCPSADKTSSLEDNSATFLMTNILPQAPEHNQQLWENLESYCRTLVSRDNEVYIIMGSYGEGGTGSMGMKITIANGKVTVPKQIWKVVVVLPVGINDVNRVSATTRVIAVNTPNSNSVNSQWGTYRTTVDAIEAATGYNLLSYVDNEVQRVIEGKVDTGPTE